jgi:2-phosphoglycerate kinase
MSRVILVGGMPAAGKSTLAAKLSHHLNLSWLSTDHVGIILRAVASRETHPELFTWEGYDEQPSSREPTADEIVDNELAKAEHNWLGVRKLIQEDYTWTDGAVIEGVDILPHLVARDFPGSDAVRAVFIGEQERGRIRATLRARGPFWDEEKEVEWVLKFGQRVRSEAERYGFAWIDIEKNDGDVLKVLGVLGLS